MSLISSQLNLEQSDWGTWRTKAFLRSEDGTRALLDSFLETGGEGGLRVSAYSV
jgi:hypothetical protein